MKRTLKKSLSVLIAALLLLPVLFMPTYAQESDSLCEMSDASVSPNALGCQHVFVTLYGGNEIRYISETHHGYFRVDINGCTRCEYTSEDLTLLYEEEHELTDYEGYEVDENGEFIYYRTCLTSGKRVYTSP